MKEAATPVGKFELNTLERPTVSVHGLGVAQAFLTPKRYHSNADREIRAICFCV